MDIFGISIDDNNRSQIIKYVRLVVKKKLRGQITTINPEILLHSRANTRYREVLQSCDMRVSDGFGISVAHWLRGRIAPFRYPGVDMTADILQLANDQKWSVFVACWKNSLCSWVQIRDFVKMRYPNIRLSGKSLPRGARHIGSTRRYDIVLCNFGAPWQEIFLSGLSGDTMGVGIGIGGSLDNLTGTLRRAPRWMRLIGLEWLWRFFLEPRRRFQRMWNAVVLFPLLVIVYIFLKKKHE